MREGLRGEIVSFEKAARLLRERRLDAQLREGKREPCDADYKERPSAGVLAMDVSGDAEAGRCHGEQALNHAGILHTVCRCPMTRAERWWAVRDLNPGPSRCKRDALTAELTAR